MLPEEEYAHWKRWLTMSEAEMEKEIGELYPEGRLRQPAFWDNERYNNPAQPVVGVSWFEAQAYANWLSAQSRAAYRLPTEAEWEAASRGREGRLFTWGDACDPLRGNVSATRVRRPTPVGIFPAGDTPEGISDLTGNVMEWTSSLYGPGMGDQTEFGYPYRADDGRENQAAGPDVRRVLRGGGWYSDGIFTHSAFRSGVHPGDRDFIEGGFRVALSSSSPIS
jgi:formylglycine-generating enzyme required for sulfatase activity